MKIDLDQAPPETQEKTPYLYAWALTEELYRQYGLEERLLPIFSNTQRSWCRRGEGLPRIDYGLKNLLWVWRHGYEEYASIQSIWPDSSNGPHFRGVYQVVLHEFAHVLQWHMDGGCFKRYKAHKEVFKECLQELLIVAPYGEFGHVWFEGLKHPTQV